MGSPSVGPGLYDPRNEARLVGVGLVANIKGRKSHRYHHRVVCRFW